jgi:Protein of unknown function (DUF2490)
MLWRESFAGWQDKHWRTDRPSEASGPDYDSVLVHWTASAIPVRRTAELLSRSAGEGSEAKLMTMRRIVSVIAVLCSCLLPVPARAQQQEEPEDPENEKQIGLWLDQGISTGLSANKSLDVEFHERFDEGASNLFEYFVQGGVAFRLRPWFTLIPIYRYQRFPGNPTIAYENRLQLNLTLSTSRGPWRPILRTLIEGRFVDNRPASARRIHLSASHFAAAGAGREQRVFYRCRKQPLRQWWQQLHSEPLPGWSTSAHR